MEGGVIEHEYLDPFDRVFMEIMEEEGKHEEAQKCLEVAKSTAYTPHSTPQNERAAKQANLADYLLQEMQRIDPHATLEGVKWIYKPADGNKASGILIFEDVYALEGHLQHLQMIRDKQVGVIQKYLEDPWLIEHVEDSPAGESNDPDYYLEKLPFLRTKKFDMRM